MLRDVIKIIEEKCDGCGLCIPNCPEGALQIIDGKARMISDIFCDGLGACIGHCPQGAIVIEKREAEPYDEKKVLLENIIPHGKNVIEAHLKHLIDHGENKLYEIAKTVIKEKGIDINFDRFEGLIVNSKCSVVDSISRIITGEKTENSYNIRKDTEDAGSSTNQTVNWPIQLHLISPTLPVFRNSDIAIVADCAGYVVKDFREKYLKNRKLIICCPKLDSGLDIYQRKIISLIDDGRIKSLTVVTTEVPCCNGLVSIVSKAVAVSKNEVPVNWIQFNIEGNKIREEIIN